jgi:DNA polymerase-3 subunit epsilon
MTPLRRWWLRRRHGSGPWRALFDVPPPDEWVSLDLETTGLDPRHDHLLSLAAVPVRGRRVVLSEAFVQLVGPPVDVGLASMRHHRLRPGDVAHAPPAEAVIADFLRWLGPRPLLGYRVGFDLAVLDHSARPLLGFPLPQARVDIVDRHLAWQRRTRPDAVQVAPLDRILADAGIPPLGRHDALADATATALAWLALGAR